MHRTGADDDRRDRMRLGVVPATRDFLDRALQAKRIDVRGAGHRAQHQRHVVRAALGIGDVLEQPSLAVLLFKTPELQPHQRVHLRVLVDRPGDALQLAGPLQGVDVLAQITVVLTGRQIGRGGGHGVFSSMRKKSARVDVG